MTLQRGILSHKTDGSLSGRPMHIVGAATLPRLTFVTSADSELVTEIEINSAAFLTLQVRLCFRKRPAPAPSARRRENPECHLPALRCTSFRDL